VGGIFITGRSNTTVSAGHATMVWCVWVVYRMVSACWRHAASMCLGLQLHVVAPYGLKACALHHACHDGMMYTAGHTMWQREPLETR
jgi:hypothetical protein